MLGAESQLEGNSFGQQLQGTSLASSFQLWAAFHTSCGASFWLKFVEQHRGTAFGATDLKNRSFASQTMSGWKFCAHGNFESSFPEPLLRISLGNRFEAWPLFSKYFAEQVWGATLRLCSSINGQLL